MVDKKYQIFVSSTYTDLKDERATVIKTILEMNHIPIGMEMFSAGDDDQWAVISRTIDTSDYYVVIIGQRYGSMTDAGSSYTEKEYDYAIEKGIPVLAFIMEDDAPSTTARESDEVYGKLKLFKEKAKRKMAQFWSSKNDLATKISTSLYTAFNQHPRTGWIRAEIDLSAVKQEVALLSKENRELREQIETYNSIKPTLDFELECDDELRYTFILADKVHRKEYSIDDISDEIITELEAREMQMSQNSLTVGELLFAQKNRNPKVDEKSDVTIERKPTDYRKLLIEAIKKYSAELPDQSIFDDYNEKLARFVNMTKNAHKVSISLSNNGTGMANNIAIKLRFPPGLLVYDSSGIRKVEEPDGFELPADPFEHMLNPSFEIPEGLRHVIEIAQMLSSEPKQNAALFTDVLHSRRNYFTIDEDYLCYKLDNLLHTHGSSSHDFYIVTTKRGTFEVEGEVICEEMPAPFKKTFIITVE